MDTVGEGGRRERRIGGRGAGRIDRRKVLRDSGEIGEGKE